MLTWCAAATEPASGTTIIRSMTSGRNDGSTRGRPMPSMRDDAPADVATALRIRREERRVLRIDHAQLGGVASIAQITADRRAGAAGARADHDPVRDRKLLFVHLLEDRLGDVVVAAPVGGPLGVGELVEVVPAGLLGETFGLGVHLRRLGHEMATATL